MTNIETSTKEVHEFFWAEMGYTNGRQVISSAQQNYSKTAEFQPFTQKNWLIYLYFTRGEFSECRFLIDQELERTFNRNIYAHYINAKIYRAEQKITEALEELQLCHKLNPTNVKYIKDVADCLFVLKRYRVALEAYIEAEHLLDKPDWEIFYNIGKCLLKLDAPDKGYEYVRRAAELSQQEEPFLLLNKLLVASKDYATSAVICTAALQHCPESVELLNQLAISNIRLSQYDLAFERLGSAIALDPQNTKSLLAIGCIMQNHGDFDVALSKYRSAAENNPNSSALWSNIGLCFYAKQKYVGAISCLSRSLWISPLNWRVAYNLGLVYLSTHQPASAFHYICAAVNLNPDYAYSFMLLGIALKLLNDSENAHKAFTRAALIAPNDLVVCLNLALSLYEMEDHEEAVGQLQRFRKTAEEEHLDVNDDCIQMLERLSQILQMDRVEFNPTVEVKKEDPDYAEINEEPNFEDPNEV